MKRILICAGILAIAISVTAYLPKQDKKINLSVTLQEADILLKALSELPLKESGNLYFNIQQQAQAQLQQQQRPIQKSDTTKKKP